MKRQKTDEHNEGIEELLLEGVLSEKTMDIPLPHQDYSENSVVSIPTHYYNQIELSPANQIPTSGTAPHTSNSANPISLDPGSHVDIATGVNPDEPFNGGQSFSFLAESNLETTKSSADPNEDFCAFCKATGELLCCERCPSAWHPYCMTPPLYELPTGFWLCPLCDETRAVSNPLLLSKKIIFKKNGTTKAGKPRLIPQKRKPDDIDPWWDCLEILQILKKQRKAWPFKEPVDSKKLNIPDYYETIILPMDLRTVEKKLFEQSYNNMSDFANDVRLIWSNAETFNGPTNDITLLARQLRELFEKNFQAKENVRRVHIEILPCTKRRLKSRPAIFHRVFKNCSIPITPTPPETSEDNSNSHDDRKPTVPDLPAQLETTPILASTETDTLRETPANQPPLGDQGLGDMEHTQSVLFALYNEPEIKPLSDPTSPV